MKMATGEGSPTPAGCQNGLPRGFWWLQRLTAAGLPIYCVVRWVLGIWEYIGVRSRSGEARGAHKTGGCPGGRARPPISWPPRSFPGLYSKSPRSSSFQKSRSRRFHSVWTSFDTPFLRNTEIGNKTTIWAGPTVNRLVPKVI